MNCDPAGPVQQSLSAGILSQVPGVLEPTTRTDAASGANQAPGSWQSVLAALDRAVEEIEPPETAAERVNRKGTSTVCLVVEFRGNILTRELKKEQEGPELAAGLESGAGLQLSTEESVGPNRQIAGPAAAACDQLIPQPRDLSEASTPLHRVAATLFDGPPIADLESSTRRTPSSTDTPFLESAAVQEDRPDRASEPAKDGGPDTQADIIDGPAKSAAPLPGAASEITRTVQAEQEQVMRAEGRQPADRRAVSSSARVENRSRIEAVLAQDAAVEAPLEQRAVTPGRGASWTFDAPEAEERAAPVLGVRLWAVSEPAHPDGKQNSLRAQPSTTTPELSPASHDTPDNPGVEQSVARFQESGQQRETAEPRSRAGRAGHELVLRPSGDEQQTGFQRDEPRPPASVGGNTNQDPRSGFRAQAGTQSVIPEVPTILSHEPLEVAKPVSASTGVGEIKVKLEGQDSDPVHVRFVERGGEIHVLVRSDQPGVSTRLSAGLEEFKRNLEAGEVQVETWVARPEGIETVEPATDARVEKAQPASGPAAGDSGQLGSRAHSGGQQRGGRPWPDWLELLAERSDEAALRRFQKGVKPWRQ